jgi:hypothetical protein
MRSVPKLLLSYLPGDLIALDAIAAGAYAYDCIALADSDVCVLPLEHLEKLRARRRTF